MAVLAAVLILQVFFRYVMNDSLEWGNDVPRLAFIMVVVLSIPLAFRFNAHVGMDFDLTKLKFVSKSALHRFNAIFLLVLFATVSWYAAQLAAEDVGSDDAGPQFAGRPVLPRRSRVGQAHCCLHVVRVLITGATARTHRSARSMITTIVLVFIFFSLTGMPIAFALGLAGMAGILVGGFPMVQLSGKIVYSIDNFPADVDPALHPRRRADVARRHHAARHRHRQCDRRPRSAAASASRPSVAAMGISGISGTAVSDAAALGGSLGPALTKAYGRSVRRLARRFGVEPRADHSAKRRHDPLRLSRRRRLGRRAVRIGRHSRRYSSDWRPWPAACSGTPTGASSRSARSRSAWAT